MRRIAYLVKVGPYNVNVGDEQRLLSDLGEEGWNLVSVVVSDRHDQIVYYFKRESGEAGDRL